MQDILESSLCTMEKAIFTYSVIELNSLMGKKSFLEHEGVAGSAAVMCATHTKTSDCKALNCLFS